MSISNLSFVKASLHQLNFSSFASPDYHHQPSMSNSDFGELVWENGQIVIKGGHFSNKVTRVHNMDSFVNSKTGKPETSLGFDEAVGRYDVAADDDVIPWFYHLDDDVLHHESASGLVAETSGITNNGLRSFSNFSAAHQLSNPVKDSRVSSVGCNGQTSDPSRKCILTEPVDQIQKQVNPMLPEYGLKENQVNDPNAQMKSIDANKKTIEPTPSLCSDYSGLRASNNPTNHMKRKHSDEEDCESSSEEDSISIRKTGCKRNRAAEVHNFNERKRREKINEKIRALQELIPNCNKFDKATMLDEAIEYLKLLQFQVQMMSMRSQMCSTNPVMPHLQQFVPMGGFGYQTQAGLLDASHGFPALASCFPGSSNPHPRLWNAAQGVHMSMYHLPGLSVPMHGAQTTLITSQPPAENSNSKDPHLS